jgi:membrane protein implicated in regulation of membrane protease activity
MYIGTSIFLIALGAILKFAVTAHLAGIDLQVAGVILMVVGAIALLISLFLMSALSDRRRGTVPDGRRRTVPDDATGERDYRY